MSLQESASTYKHLQLVFEENGALLWLILNRPSAHNAINKEIRDELHNVIDKLMVDKSVRAVILAGEGKNFSVGLDLRALLAEPEYFRDIESQELFSTFTWKMRQIPQPIIAALQGNVMGFGFAMALASDLRICTPNTKMASAAIKLGLTSCDMGISWFLPRLVGAGISSELLLTGGIIDAERALRYGLVNDVVDSAKLHERARGFAKQMLEASPKGLRLTKQQLNASLESHLRSVLTSEDSIQIHLGNDKESQAFGDNHIRKITRGAKL
ncbi:hypothetical protein SpCBS45565_g07119 [Spizellomyces sp. 'palustris']|nr:hypothetical protein SpCBS45565_g07119 [Spizellomyces sp. 'palustris']